MNWKRLNRKIHTWGSIIVALPLLIVLLSGVVLMVKKEFTWIQPATMKGVAKTPELTFPKILEIASTVPEAGISDWKHIDRLDVRPKKGVVKVRAKNKWEIQIDNKNGEILQVMYRRSDLFEELHDGSYFDAKMWLFLPASIGLVIVWITGVYLFIVPRVGKKKKAALAE